jgi:predicted RNA-binding protein YlqC (UPF0109 family)
MQDLATYLARRLVDNPGDVRVEAQTREDSIRLRVSVAPEDVGKIIGKQGRIIRAMRTVVRSGGARNGQRVMLEIVE